MELLLLAASGTVPWWQTPGGIMLIVSIIGALCVNIR